MIVILILTLAALVPPVVLMVIIYNKDKTEKEPVGLILKLLLFGALTVIPAGIIESICESYVIPSLGISSGTVLYDFVLYFMVVAWTEEGVKHFALKRITWTHPAFDYSFDAVVYSVAVGLGFAAAENVSYVFMYGLSTALTRAMTAIPGHCIFAIYMGYFYGMARIRYTHLQPARSSANMFLSMLVPVLMHGAYDFIVSEGSQMMTVIFFIYLVCLDIAAIVTVNRSQKKDTHI